MVAQSTRLLKASGRFVVQVVNWNKFQHSGTTDFDVKTLSDGRTFHRRYEHTDASQVIFHTAIKKDGKVQGAWAAPLYPKYQQATVAALQAAGLTVSGQFGDYQKSTFDPLTSPAMILVTAKA